MLISTFGKTFALRSTIISRISSSLYIGGYAGVWKEHKSDATVYDAVENKTSAKFKPRSLNTPMNFKQWKMHGPRLYEKRLRFLMKAGNGAKALETLEDMKKQQVDISPVAYNMVISVLAKQGDIVKAFKLFNEMKKCSVLPTERTYSSLFHGCAVAGKKSLRIFDKIVAEMERRSVTAGTITSNIMIQALALCEEPDRALEIYDSMISSHTPVDLHTFSALLMAAMAKTNDDGLKIAVGIWNELRRTDLTPDIYCYNLFLECLKDCSYSDSWVEKISKDKANELPEYDGQCLGYLRLNFAKDFKIQLYITNSGARKLILTDVEAIMNAMDNDNVKPNTKTLHFLTLLLPTSITSKAIPQIVDRYQLKGDAMFFNGLIRNVTATEGFSAAMELLRSMDNKGITANDFTYQAIASCCHSKQEATQLLTVIKDKSHCPNEFVWGTLCGEAAKGQNYDYLLHILKEMKSMSCLPNKRIISILDAACTRKDNDSPEEHRRYCKYYVSWRRELYNTNST